MGLWEDKEATAAMLERHSQDNSDNEATHRFQVLFESMV